MIRSGLKLTALLLMMAGCATLWSHNQQKALWPEKTAQSVRLPAQPAPPAVRALALAQGLPVMAHPTRAGYLQSSAPMTAAQFNLWLQRLAREQLSPVSMTLTPATGDGLLTVSDTGFTHE